METKQTGGCGERNNILALKRPQQAGNSTHSSFEPFDGIRGFFIYPFG